MLVIKIITIFLNIRWFSQFSTISHFSTLTQIFCMTMPSAYIPIVIIMCSRNHNKSIYCSLAPHKEKYPNIDLYEVRELERSLFCVFCIMCMCVLNIWPITTTNVKLFKNIPLSFVILNLLLQYSFNSQGINRISTPQHHKHLCTPVG